MTTAPPTRRRLYQFGLGTMFIVPAAVALFIWAIASIRERQEILTWLNENGGSATPVDEQSKLHQLREEIELPELRRMHLALLEREQQLKYERGLKRNGAILPSSWCAIEAPDINTIVQDYQKSDDERLSPALREARAQIVADLRNIQTLRDEITP